MFDNEGTTVKVIVTLPAASSGRSYRFYCQDADGIRVVPNATPGTDTIRVATVVSKAGGYIESVTIGSYIELEAVNSSEWIATVMTGLWDVETS
jgi:hypothetical protein